MKLSLIYPVDSVSISQGFGENPQFYSDPKYGGIKGHNGIDFRTGHGTPVYATHDGFAYYEYDGAQGEGVVIRTNDQFDNPEGTGECYYKTIYWHLCDAIIDPQFTSPIYKAVGYSPDETGISNIGTPVSTGDLIGYADNTGASTGDHLHFGLKPVAYKEAWGTWFNLEQKNGYLGAIDAMPYFNTYTPKSISIMMQIIEALKQLIILLNDKMTQASH